MTSSRRTVSIIIPAYNAERSLASAVRSALAQTHEAVEVVIVDDGSTDATRDVAEGLEGHDHRVRLVCHDSNKGRLEARRTGVAAARGERMLFLDADDELDPTFCKTCLSGSNASFDVVHVGFNLRYRRPVTDEQRARDDAYCQPPAQDAFGDDITHIIFRDRKGPWSLCGKLFVTAQLRDAFEQIPPSSINQAEDACVFFILSTIAKSYRGIPSYRGYTYNYDSGQSDAAWTSMDLEQFSYSCGYVDAMLRIQSYLERNSLTERLRDDYEQAYREHLMSVAGKLCCQVRPEFRAQALHEFAGRWPRADVAGAVADVSWNASASCLDDFSSSPSLAIPARKVKTVALLYYQLTLGGGERVASELMRIWANMGYQVVFLTEKPVQDEEYPLPASARRAVLPDSWKVSASRSYLPRARALAKALADHDIDLLVDLEWDNSLFGWDLLTCRLCGVPIISYTQSSFGAIFRRADPNGLQLPLLYRHLSGVISLSQSDQAFWAQFNGRSWQTPNTLTLPPDTAGRAALDNHEIVWIGRLHREEKRPIEALRIMAHLAKRDKRAHLTIVGPSTDTCTIQELELEADGLGIAEHVYFAGPTDDVTPYLRRASAYLLTSGFEGWCLSLAEAKATGLPTVMYALPYLELTRDSRGIIQVSRNGDRTDVTYGETGGTKTIDVPPAEAAADALATILSDESLRMRLSDEAFSSVEELAAFDFSSLWASIFQEAGTKPLPDEPTGGEAQTAMWDTLLEGCSHAGRELARSRTELSEAHDETEAQRTRAERDEHELDRTNAHLDEVKSSTTWRVGSVVTWLPRMGKESLRRLKRRRR